MRRSLLAVLAATALVLVGLGGYAVAQSRAVPQAAKVAKVCTNAKHVVSLIKAGRCAAGSRKVTLPAVGGPGQALGFAHIKSDGTLDSSRSYRVRSANLVTTIDGFWCFKGMSFTPRSAMVTLDYHGIFNGDIPQATVILPPDPSDCGLTSAQAEVFTGLVASSSSTDGKKLGFYVVFY